MHMGGILFKCDVTGKRLSNNIEAERTSVDPIMIRSNDIDSLILRKGDNVYYSSNEFLISEVYKILLVFSGGILVKKTQ